MKRRHRNFLNALADLLEDYSAEISYTIDDDGLHISVDGEEVYVGWLSQDYAENLRK